MAKTEIMHKQLHNLNEIKNFKYTGYVWKSDKPEPDILFNEIFDFSGIKTNPFIIEANLFAEDDKTSVSIKPLNGNYFILEIDLSKAANVSSQIREYKYIANSALCKIKKLKFKQYWEEIEDPYCENLPVLTPAWRAFVGFEKEDEK